MTISRSKAESPLRLLIVDNEEVIGNIFGSIFPKPAYSVVQAKTGEAATIMARQQPFNLAFIDIFMPGMSGVETSLQLKHTQPNLNVVLMSGAVLGDPAEAVADAEAYCFLAKPFSVAKVRAIVEQLLRPPETPVRPLVG